MNFLDCEHETFWNDKIAELKALGKADVYYKSLIYILGICPVTREHFREIFDIKNGEINVNSIQAGWQTGTSAKVTRMAFSLWNSGCMFDSEEDMNNDRKSSYYNPSEIFCCTYAPYFYEGVKIRYPEYTNEGGDYER